MLGFTPLSSHPPGDAGNGVFAVIAATAAVTAGASSTHGAAASGTATVQLGASISASHGVAAGITGMVPWPRDFTAQAEGTFTFPFKATVAAPVSLVPQATGAYQVFGTGSAAVPLVVFAADQSTYVDGSPSLEILPSATVAFQVSGSAYPVLDVVPYVKAAYRVYGDSAPTLSILASGAVLVTEFTDFQFDGVDWVYPAANAVNFFLPVRDAVPIPCDATWVGVFPLATPPTTNTDFDWRQNTPGGSSLIELFAEAEGVHGVSGYGTAEINAEADAGGSFTAPGGGEVLVPPAGSSTLAGSVVRVGDLSTGHGAHPARRALNGNLKLFIGGLAAVCEGDLWEEHSTDPDGPAYAVSSNPKLYVDGKPVIVVGDQLTCGDSVATGSDTLVVT